MSQNERTNNVYSLSFTKANPGAKKTKSLNYNIQFSGDFIKKLNNIILQKLFLRLQTIQY